MPTPFVLIVDGDPTLRSYYQELPRETGCTVQIVTSGAEGLRQLGQHSPDVLITGLQLPDIHMPELLQRIYAYKNPPEIIVLFDQPLDESVIASLPADVRTCLVKPFEPGRLQRMIHSSIDQRALVHENTRLKNQLRLFRQAQHLITSIDLDRLLPEATTALINELDRGRGLAFLTTGTEIRICDNHGLTGEDATALAGVLRPFLDQAAGFSILDRGSLPASLAAALNIETIAMFPLYCERSFKGGIIVVNPADGDFTQPLPRENLAFLAGQITIGFDNAFRFQGARELIYTDDLTGLYNYRYLQHLLDQEIRRTERYGLAFSVIFIDLDRFKEINDTRGHLIGSDVLREVAELLHHSVREVDALFRYGGDEFTALLVETDSAGAAIVGERIRTSIENHTFQTATSESVRLTATIGYATFPDNAADKKAILDMADRAMYVGKAQRNVVLGAWEIPS